MMTFTKSRLAPLKESSLTIPKLELQATVLRVRMEEAIPIETNVKPNSIYLWSDSRTVIKYTSSIPSMKVTLSS